MQVNDISSTFFFSKTISFFDDIILPDINDLAAIFVPKASDFKAAKYEIQTSTCHATLFRCKFSSIFPVFHLA